MSRGRDFRRSRWKDDDECVDDPFNRSQSADTARRRDAALPAHLHGLIQKTNQSVKPFSPTSCSSSMEVASLTHTITPTSSLDIMRRLQDSGLSLKTSTEMLNLLNRIWSLEEQQASNSSLIKSLKAELERAGLQIRDLIRERRSYRHEIDNLMKQFAMENLVLKKKEHGRAKYVVQSIRVELENERKLRKHSEVLCERLGREFSEASSKLCEVSRVLERRNESISLLVDLCDEFAKGVADYEKEVKLLKGKSGKSSIEKTEKLVYKMSEAWCVGRLQMMKDEVKGVVNKQDLVIEKIIKGAAKEFLKKLDNLHLGRISDDLNLFELNKNREDPKVLNNRNKEGNVDANEIETCVIENLEANYRGEKKEIKYEAKHSGSCGAVHVQRLDCGCMSQEHEELENSSRSLLESKQNSLKAKLLEARLEGRHARLKGARNSDIFGTGN